jgi:gamma-glutamyl-gamma-aminobutyrate hydrolase PuuD
MIDLANWKKVNPDFPKLGICRGAQLGNILSGGRLWQDVTGHQSQHHEVQVTLKGETYLARVNSYHHQQCILTKQATPLVMARCAKKKIGLGIYQELKMNEWEDPEAFYYDHTNFLGVQWHPEWGVGETSQFSVFKVLFDVFLPEDLYKSAGDF